MSGWIGVDLDGTLAHYPPPGGIDTIGEPIPLMAERVRGWLAEGREVRIVTARVAATGALVLGHDGMSQVDGCNFASEQRGLVQDWTEEHFGVRLAVTASKDFGMIELWDDRAVQVEMNTGRMIVGRKTQGFGEDET